MTGRARVWNEHRDGLTYEENWKGQKIRIEAGKYIEMDYYEAVEFKSHPTPIKLTPENTHDPRGFKPLRVEQIKDEASTLESTPGVFVCHVNGKQFSTEKELTDYVKANFSHLLTTDAEGEEEVKRRGRGRPRKEEVSNEHSEA